MLGCGNVRRKPMSYSTITPRTVSVQNERGGSPGSSVSTSNSSFPRRIFSWSFCPCDHERGEFSPMDWRRLQFFENLVGSRASECPLVPLLCLVRRHSTTDNGLLIRRQVHDRNLTVSPLPLIKRGPMLGRCDGWMGLPLVLQFTHDHHAFHEDAKPGDLSLQLPIRWRSSSNQFTTRRNRSGL